MPGGSGGLLDHLSARDSARDLDLLRQRLGDERLTYLGVSYGTMLGAAYVVEFPGLVERMVLDAGVDPRRPVALTQAVGPERALDAFASWCRASGCELGADARERVAVLLLNLDAAPLPTTDGRHLTQTLATAGLVTLLGLGDSAWPRISDALAAAEAGDPGPLLQAADAQTGRRPDGTHDLLASFTATWCADDPTRTASDAETRWRADVTEAPLFGDTMGIPWMCVGWTARPAPPLRFGDADAAAPVVVLTQPGDAVTPTEWSRALADKTGGMLVSVEGIDHGSFGRGNACADAIVVATLSGDLLPPPGASCP